MIQRCMALLLIILTVVLAGCGGDAPSTTQEQAGAAQAPGSSVGSEGDATAALDASYEGALSTGNQLALGTLLLEDTPNAVTPQEATTLLPLWQAIQGGSLQSEAEINAVLKQIEGTLMPEQVTAIAAMQLTFEDLGSWAQEQGMNLGLSPEAMATRQAGGAEPGAPGNMSEDERAAMRATAQAGGMGPLGAMSEEQREAMRATAEASGMSFPGARDGSLPGRGAGAGGGQVVFLAQPLIELLTQRATQ